MQISIFAASMRLHGKFISKFPSLHCFTMCMAVIFIFFITNKGYGQARSNTPKSDSSAAKDSIKMNVGKILTDSTLKDSTAISADTSRKKMLEDSLGIKISKDALPSVVKAEAQDSAIMDMATNQSYLYGKAQVNYEDLQINAGQITYEQNTNKMSAGPQLGSKDTSMTRGTFTQGKEKFSYDSIQYNAKSKRAIVRNVRTQYGEGFMHSEQIKRNPDQVVFGAHSVYTTCALDTPHFGIVARRIKVIPGKLIVSGPADIYIEGVPTPLFIPFALFPISQKQKSGFVIPTYTVEQARGLGLLNGGYYFYLNDHADLLAQTNIYTKGSYAVSAISNYSSIYQYKGAFNLSYAYNKTGEDFEPGATVQKDFMINWRHASDGKAVPGQSFNASVQIGTSSFYSNNSYDPNQILQNQYASNISYSKNWQGTPFSFTASALHSQNTATKQINVTLPAINFHVTQINPFQRKSSVGIHWYDKITFSYTADVLNRTTFYDSTFNPGNMSFHDFHAGVHHSIPVGASYTIFRYINMSFSASYNEYWLTDKLHVAYNPGDAKIDSIQNTGFYTARDFNTGVNFSTRIYGMKLFKTGKLRGIRHVITPSVGVSYHPDFGASPFNYYYRTRLDTSSTYTYQSPYAQSIVGIPPLGKAGNINFGINNNLQIKVRNSKDTVTGTKNVSLIDAFGFAASYNMAADSFQWSNIRASFSTNVLDKVNISSSATFDPYAFDYNTGRRLPQTMEEMGFGLARFTGATVSLGSNFHSRAKGGANNPTNTEEYNRVMRNAGYNEYVDFNIPWSFNMSYSLSAAKNYTYYTKRDTLVLSQNITFQGELQITARWKVSVNSGYNFSAKALTLTSIDVYRDLHCWAMHLQAVPFGPRKSYNFTINVKASVLQELKLMRRRDFRDTPF